MDSGEFVNSCKYDNIQKTERDVCDDIDVRKQIPLKRDKIIPKTIVNIC